MRKLTLVLMSLALCSVGLGADETIRALQTKLKTGGFYAGEVNGEYTSDTAAAVTRYQIRNGLEITGTLNVETKQSLGVAAEGKAEAPTPKVGEDVWRYLRKSDQEYLERLVAAKAAEKQSRGIPAQTGASAQPDSGAQTDASAQTEVRAIQAPPPPPARPAGNAAVDPERLRDYVAAFVLAGLDPHVGSELEFFADRVDYFDEGVLDRERIRRGLAQYDRKWPQRNFRLAGPIDVQPESNGRLRVSFPLRFQLRSGSKSSAGTVRKTLVLQPNGDDLQIVAVHERRAN